MRLLGNHRLRLTDPCLPNKALAVLGLPHQPRGLRFLVVNGERVQAIELGVRGRKYLAARSGWTHSVWGTSGPNQVCTLPGSTLGNTLVSWTAYYQKGTFFSYARERGLIALILMWVGLCSVHLLPRSIMAQRRHLDRVLRSR